MVTMVRAFDLKKIGPGGGDESEGIIVHQVPLKSVRTWLKSKEKKGFLIEPKVYAGLYFLNQ
jgi:ADP-ribose pyrophosphatase